jgi:hypothetical protein
MQEVEVQTLSEFLGEEPKPLPETDFPAYNTDAGIYESNFQEVMQFVFNHTTFDPDDEMDQAVLEAMKPLGVEPGREYSPDDVPEIDGKALGAAAERIQGETLALAMRPEGNPYVNDMFKPKGEMRQEVMVFQSFVGPIGVPAHQAVYPGIPTADGEPMNAQHDYVVRMSPDEMPPAEAFWSVTLYDAENGFFIPNDHKKYSVGENGGMKLNEDGGIEIYIAAEQPEGVPEENWLPINRGDEDLDMVMRIYAPDEERLKTWQAPKAERVQ